MGAHPKKKRSCAPCTLESLALEYRWVAEQIGRLTGMTCPVIHIIGGGAKNQLLNPFTTNATGRTVIAGPVEATAIGDILVQAIAMGEIASLDQGRELVGKSFELKTYRPFDTAAWDEAYATYEGLKKR